MKQALILALLLGGEAALANWWDITISDEKCEANWRMEIVTQYPNLGFRVQVAVTSNTVSRRRNLGHEDPFLPVVSWRGLTYYTGDSIGELRTGEGGRQTVPGLKVRLFPDDEEPQGFFEPELLEAVDYGDGVEDLEWLSFDLTDRLRKWGTAKETSDDEGVRLPEVRLILTWPGDESINEEFFLDVPLWRTSNMMNKILRCTEGLKDSI